MSKNVTLLFGEETFLVEEKAAKWHQPDAFVEKMEGVIDLSQLMQLIQSDSLFSPQTHIILKRPHFLTQALTDAEFNTFKRLIDTALASPHRLLLIFPDKLDQRKKVIQFLKKTVDCVECVPFKDWEQDKVLQWIRQRGSALGKSIAPEAAMAIEQIGGTQLRILAAEIDKIAAYVGNQPSIEIADMEALASGGGASIFQLSEAMKRRQGAHIA